MLENLPSVVALLTHSQINQVAVKALYNLLGQIHIKKFSSSLWRNFSVICPFVKG